MPSAASQEDVSTDQIVGVTRTLAHHSAALRYDDLPNYAVQAAKQFMLDTLAVAWAGSNAPGCVQAHALLADEAGRPDSTVWAYGNRLPAGSSAFLNSMFAAALDFDSLGRDSPVHVNIVVLPAALALAERAHASGKEFLTALVLGCDLMCRMGASCEAPGNPHRGWFYTSVHGVFGAAAAGARLLRLDAAATQHALGIAYGQAAGTQQAVIEPSLTKRMQSAFAARAGVFAAQLAASGISAPRAVIDGQFGLYRMYQEGDTARLLSGLGQRFENGNLSIKKFPSCGCNHTAIEGALRLAREHDLRAEEIEGIEVNISPFMDRLVGGRFDPSGDPQVAAQFSIRYSIACAIVRRRLGLAELDEAIVRDPLIGRLVEKVKVIVDRANSGKRGPIMLRIRSRRHGELACRVEHVPGSEHAPLSAQDITDKCRDCFVRGTRPLNERQCELLMERVAGIENVTDMGAFFADIL